MGWKHTNRNRKGNKSNSKWAFKRTSKYHSNKQVRIEVTEEVIHDLLCISKDTSVEDCGVLIGTCTNNGSYRINFVSPSCSVKKEAKHCECVRDAKIANKYIQQQFLASNGTRVYFGEWHSHPETKPTPSSVDINSLKDVFWNSQIPINVIFLAIIGINDIFWGIYDGTSFYESDVVVV